MNRMRESKRFFWRLFPKIQTDRIEKGGDAVRVTQNSCYVHFLPVLPVLTWRPVASPSCDSFFFPILPSPPPVSRRCLLFHLLALNLPLPHTHAGWKSIIWSGNERVKRGERMLQLLWRNCDGMEGMREIYERDEIFVCLSADDWLVWGWIANMFTICSHPWCTCFYCNSPRRRHHTFSFCWPFDVASVLFLYLLLYFQNIKSNEY